MGAKLDKDLKDKETGDPLPYSTEAEEGNSLSKAFTPDCTNRTSLGFLPIPFHRIYTEESTGEETLNLLYRAPGIEPCKYLATSSAEPSYSLGALRDKVVSYLCTHVSAMVYPQSLSIPLTNDESCLVGFSLSASTVR